MRFRSWTESNLSTQGYSLTHEESRRLAIGLRFPTGLCLLLVATALSFQSTVMLFALSGIGAAGGFGKRHPFDLLWNHAVRFPLGAPPLPENPPRRRHAFKLATAWLTAVAGLFLAGESAAALVLGGLLVVACTVVTVTNFCIPSELLAWWDRRHRGEAIATPSTTSRPGSSRGSRSPGRVRTIYTDNRRGAAPRSREGVR